MDHTLIEFKRGAIRPIECFKAGWDLIKDQYWLFMGMAFVGIFLGSMAPMGILLGPMMCALHLAFFHRARGQTVRFEDLTKGFEYFLQSLIATLIQVIPMMIIIVPFYLIGAVGFMAVMGRAAQSRQDASPADLLLMFGTFAIMVIIIFAISILIGTLFLFTYPLIVDKRLSGVDAVKLSIKAAFANLGGILGLTLLGFVLGLAGMLLCYVGGFFVMPIGLAARHVAYRQVFENV